MITVVILLIFLTNVKAINGKSILTTKNFENLESIDSRKNMDLAARIISATDFDKEVFSTTPSDGRRLEPSDQIRKKRRRTRTTTTSEPTTTTTTQFTSRSSQTTTMMKVWTTSLDPLRIMLAKKLPGNPAPDQVGMLDKHIMHPVTQPLWIFEDYDDSSSRIDTVREDWKTCESQMVRCVGDNDYSQPVCVVDLTMDERVSAVARNKGFHSQCEVDYRNCLKRYESTGKYYADSYEEDYLEFLHYGWCETCEQQFQSTYNLNCSIPQNYKTKNIEYKPDVYQSGR